VAPVGNTADTVAPLQQGRMIELPGMLIRTLAVPGKTETTGILRGDRYQEFMILIENTLAQIERFQKSGPLDKQINGWRNIFGEKFPDRR
jgi:hypothetical protein